MWKDMIAGADGRSVAADERDGVIYMKIDESRIMAKFEEVINLMTVPKEDYMRRVHRIEELEGEVLLLRAALARAELTIKPLRDGTHVMVHVNEDYRHWRDKENAERWYAAGTDGNGKIRY